MVSLLSTTNVAFGQFAIDYNALNGQGKILVNSTVKNIKPESRGVRLVEISNNSNMIPLLDGKEDSVYSSGPMSFVDTFNVSLQFPITYYVRETVIVSDTNGVFDTAAGVSFRPVFVTPKFTKPTQALNKLLVSQTTGIVSGNFTSGFDTAQVEIIVSYGDSMYQNPSTKYPYKGKVLPKAGLNQMSSQSFTINTGAPNYLFSYKIRVYNSIADTLSPVFWGKTLSSPSPAMVSSPYNFNGWADSLVFYDETVTSGLQTTHIAYIANSMTAKAFDSIAIIISAGQADGTVLRNSFKNLTPEKDYYVWSGVKNSLNTVPFTSNRMLVQTSKQTISVFNLKMDSTVHVSKTSEAIYWESSTPAGESGHVILLGRVYPDGQAVVLEDIAVSGYKKGVSYFPNCIQGQVYEVTIYGYDDNFTKDYDAWVIKDTFTFYPNYTASARKNLEKESLKLSVYPNPAKDWIESSETIALFNTQGQKVAEGNKLFIENLPRGLYYYRSSGKNIYSGKVLLE